MRFRKKPVVIEAIQWTGDNESDVLSFGRGVLTIHHEANGARRVTVRTLEGEMGAFVGDWIIRGVAGEIYPCKPDIFEKTYEREWA